MRLGEGASWGSAHLLISTVKSPSEAPLRALEPGTVHRHWGGKNSAWRKSGRAHVPHGPLQARAEGHRPARGRLGLSTLPAGRGQWGCLRGLSGEGGKAMVKAGVRKTGIERDRAGRGPCAGLCPHVGAS